MSISRIFGFFFHPMISNRSVATAASDRVMVCMASSWRDFNLSRGTSKHEFAPACWRESRRVGTASALGSPGGSPWLDEKLALLCPRIHPGSSARFSRTLRHGRFEDVDTEDHRTLS